MFTPTILFALLFSGINCYDLIDFVPLIDPDMEADYEAFGGAYNVGGDPQKVAKLQSAMLKDAKEAVDQGKEQSITKVENDIAAFSCPHKYFKDSISSIESNCKECAALLTKVIERTNQINNFTWSDGVVMYFEQAENPWGCFFSWGELASDAKMKFIEESHDSNDLKHYWTTMQESYLMKSVLTHALTGRGKPDFGKRRGPSKRRLRVESLDWRDCGNKENPLGTFNNLAFEPNPLLIDHDVSFSASVNILRPIKSPIKGSYKIWRDTWVMWAFITEDSWEDFCLEWPIPRGTYPDEYNNTNIPKECPIEPGSYDLPMRKVAYIYPHILPNWLAAGKYLIQLFLSEEGNWQAMCAEIKISLSY